MADIFTTKAPGIMRKLMADFGLDELSAAAILGNLGHESGGFRFLQEKKPLIPGSAGGYGWAQWTGPRRRAYEAYCARNKLDPASDQANYAFLFVELTGSEKAAIPAVKAPGSLAAKVGAFERAFERAGIKHYDSRVKWAERALAAYRAAPGAPVAPPSPRPPQGVPGPVKPKPGGPEAGTVGAGGVIIAGGAKAASDAGMSGVEIAALVTGALALVIVVTWLVWRWRKKRAP